MKPKTATVLLIILNTLAFFAGMWAAFGSMESGRSIGAVLWQGAIFLAFFSAPIIFVWRYFRDGYGFSRKKFLLCTLLPPSIVTQLLFVILVMWASTLGSDNGGYGGLAVLGIMFALLAAAFCLIVSVVGWLSIEEDGFVKIRSATAKKAISIILLTVCGALIFWRLYGLLNGPLAALYGRVYIVKSGMSEYVTRYILKTLIPAGFWALPIGFGASAIMRVYRREYSVKAPLFMILAFLPSLIIAGVRMALIYFGDKEKYFFRNGFIDLLDTFILTAAVAVMTALIAFVSFLLSRRHRY